MRIRTNDTPSRCVLAAATMFVSGVILLPADSIIITRPVVAIVAPAKEDSLPKPRGEEVSFSAPMQQQMVPSHEFIQRPRPQQRSAEEEDEEKIHPLLRNPKKLPGIFGKDPLKPAPTFAEKNNPLRLPWRTSDDDQKEEARSLSPVNSLDWNERDSRQPQKGGLGQNRARVGDQGDERQSDPFKPSRERTDERHDPLRAPTSFDPLAFRMREKPSAAALEKRAAFQELLNPQSVVAAKQSGSLEPVTTFEAPEPLVRPSVPASAPNSFSANPNQPLVGRGPMDPDQAFQRRQARLVGADLEDPSKPYSVGPQKSPASRTAEPLHQTPLLRQPLQREIPARRF